MVRKKIKRIYLILFFYWRGGLETKSYRFYKNLKSLGIDVKIVSLLNSKKFTKYTFVKDEIIFIPKKEFLVWLKNENLTKKDVVLLLTAGTKQDESDKQKIDKTELPFYFEFFKEFKKATFGLNIISNYETKVRPYYKELLDRSDFIVSEHNLKQNENKFIIYDWNLKKELTWNTPAFMWLNTTSPEEINYILESYKELKEKGKNYKVLKKISYCGRISPEKDIKNIVKTFLELEKLNKYFDLKLNGIDNGTRTKWFLSTSFSKENWQKFFTGAFDFEKDIKILLKQVSLGINLRSKNMSFENYPKLENSVLEYCIHGVVPIINDHFFPREEFIKNSFNFNFLEYVDKSSLSELILENYKDWEKLNKMRIRNFANILKNYDGRNEAKRFIKFLNNL